MKRYLLSLLFTICIAPAFAQRFSQYYTGTLFDAFENPAQRAFIPDSSRALASNFLFPNFSANALLTGNGQSAILHRLFSYNYRVKDSSRLQLDNAKNNHISANLNTYWLMFKIFTSLDGNQEIGISAQTRAESRGVISDPAVGLTSGITRFNNTTYDNNLTGRAYYQAYHQLSFSYREQVSNQFALGIKLSALMGIAYNNLIIDQSRITFGNESEATLALRGRLYSSYVPGEFTRRDLLPTFRNPGASISIGSMLRTRDGFVLQWNIKDLGFIHWSNRSQVYNYAGSSPLSFTTQGTREDSLYHALNRVVQTNPVSGSFTTHTDGRAEFGASRTFYITDDRYIKYTPALVLSKQLFDRGMEGALVNHLQYHNAVFTLTGMYNDLRLFSLGTQLMIKSPNVDFFIGSDAVAQTIRTAREARKNEDVINQYNPYSAASFYMGFSIKFGDWIEHPMNASHIPMGEKGFFGRLYNRLFKTDK